jgi:molybdopterin-guanine dinucleotide biosynthesis protein A
VNHLLAACGVPKYHRQVHPIAAFILAGGRSTRMASDKAFLELGGQTLLARSLALARTATTDVRIVGDPGKFAAFGTVVPDVFPGRGPLGGIHAALATSPTDTNLILGVDLPFLTSRFLEYLVAQAQSAETTVTVPSAGGHLHPLCGVYRQPFRAVAQRALSEGRNKVDALFSEVSVRFITEEELAAAGFDPSIFRNLNTAEEWERARQDLAGG